MAWGSSKVALAAALTAALTCSPAQGASRDGTATRAYLKADYALVKFARAKRTASNAALQGLLDGVRRTCPRIALDSPQVTDSEQLSNEIVGAMIVAGTLPDKPAIARFARAVAGLRWSSSRLTRRIHTYARELKKLVTLAPADICADVGAWVASGYRTLPTPTVAFNRHYKAVNVPIGELPEPQLTRSAGSGQRRLLDRIRRIEAAIADFEAEAVETWAQIMDTLVLQP
jgi:hypothetical protein